jgi:hypothetical protein
MIFLEVTCMRKTFLWFRPLLEMEPSRASFFVWVIAWCALCLAAPASAQIDRPGAHPNYSVELEPHGLVQWDVEPSNHTGFGLGLRASIPVIRSGPVQTINNSLAVAFGLDWAHSGHCHASVGRVAITGNCDVDNFEIPLVLQWNFFFTDIVGLLVELGLDVRYETWDSIDDNNDDDVEVFPQFLVGPRFIVGRNIAIPIRIGFPYLSVGVSFLL